MPTYGYRCPKCGHEYEELQKMSDATPAACPACDTPGIRLISGGAGLVFKGSGFYETDYKRAKPKDGDKKDKRKKKKEGTDKADKETSKKEASPSPKGSSGDDR